LEDEVVEEERPVVRVRNLMSMPIITIDPEALVIKAAMPRLQGVNAQVEVDS
jgi:hypothetical protein